MIIPRGPGRRSASPCPAVARSVDRDAVIIVMMDRIVNILLHSRCDPKLVTSSFILGIYKIRDWVYNNQVSQGGNGNDQPELSQDHELLRPARPAPNRSELLQQGSARQHRPRFSRSVARFISSRIFHLQLLPGRRSRFENLSQGARRSSTAVSRPSPLSNEKSRIRSRNFPSRKIGGKNKRVILLQLLHVTKVTRTYT